MPNLDTRTTKTPAVDDYTYLLSNDGTVEGKVELQDVTVIPETTRTINFTSSQTASQINAVISAVGRYIPKDVTITFQFANGTYSLNNILLFRGFYGGGQIYIYGNTSETNATVLHTSQDVVLDFKGNATDGLRVDRNSVHVYIFNLRVEVDDTENPFYMLSCTGFNQVWYSYALINGTSNGGHGILAHQHTNVEVRNTYVTGGESGIFALSQSTAYSNGVDDTGTQPKYGLKAQASIIYKNSTQPTGSTSNENLVAGGEIR